MPSSNTITIIDYSRLLSSMSYVENSANVTAGQDFTTPPSISQNGGVFTVTFLADRKNSESIATLFNTNSGGAAFEYAAVSGGGTPDELNFYFTVQLNFTLGQDMVSATLNLAQGHSVLSVSNNWWLGGSIVNSSQPSLNIPINSNNTLVLYLSGTNDSYTLEL